MKKLLLFILLLGWISTLHAQKATLSGHIKDAASGEILIGASIYEAKSYQGTTSNTYGFFSLTLDRGPHEIVFSFIGYETIKMTLDLSANKSLDVALKSLDLRLGEVTVSGEVYERVHTQTQMSAIKIPMRQIEKLPTFFGERDVLKMIQLMPGVQSGQEGSSGLYVRGGGPDQNLILLDGVPVYNVNHLFGFFSVFNSSALNHVEIIKGGFPARYGGRVSSVLDIRMKEGNMKEFKGEGSIGVIASKLTLEGPIWKDHTSFIVSGRRTYLDVLMQPFIGLANAQEGYQINAGYYFYDLNAKINHKFSDKSRLYFSSYLGKDKAYIRMKDEYSFYQENYKTEADNGLYWGNMISMLRYNHVINSKLFANATATYSRYRFNVYAGYEDETTVQDSTWKNGFAYDYFSGIYDYSGKIDFDYLPSPNHYIRFGGGAINHTFSPGVNTFKFTMNNVVGDTTIGQNNKIANEYYLYFEDDIKIGSRLKINPGFHLSSFAVDDTVYQHFQPRFSLNFLLLPNLSYKLSYSTMAQYLHLLTNGTIGLPTDLWVPVTDSVPPVTSNQIATGFAYTLLDDYEFSIEGYYKIMNNLIEYKDGAGFLGTGSGWDQKIEIGNGEAYGLEFFLHKKTGKLSGWVGYTLAWSNRTFENLNFGKTFPYKYDRRHDVSVALVYDPQITIGQKDWKVDFGLTWVYGTGNAVSLPISTYLSNDPLGQNNYFYWEGMQNMGYYSEIENYANRNDFREPAYHRMDFSINLVRDRGTWESGWNISVYNLYNQLNPFYLYFDTEYYETASGYTEKKVLKQISLFPMIPSVSYFFKF
jgi:hypothetical protein